MAIFNVFHKVKLMFDIDMPFEIAISQHIIKLIKFYYFDLNYF